MEDPGTLIRFYPAASDARAPLLSAEDLVTLGLTEGTAAYRTGRVRALHPIALPFMLDRIAWASVHCLFL